MAEAFRPEDLDRLEDALEDLETMDLPGDLDEPVRARLVAYRDILTLSRTALPLEEVPVGLLDAVLAEARGERTAESGVLAASEIAAPTVVTQGAGAADSARSGTWGRLRRVFLVPVFALAGSAVLVLWVLDPGAATEPKMVAESGVTRGEAPLVQAPVAPAEERPREKLEATQPQSVAAAAPEPGAPTALDEAARRQEGAGAEGVAGPSEREPETRRPADPRLEDGLPANPGDTVPRGGAKAPSAKPTPSKKEADGWDPAPTTPPPAQEPAVAVDWAHIADADSKRRANKCGLAGITYRRATQTPDARIAARGHAGLGLCAEQQGADGSEAFARARKLDVSIDAFIADERRRAYRPGTKSSKRKAAPSAEAEADVNETY